MMQYLFAIFAPMRYLCILLIILAPAIFCHAQKFRVATWNVENTFDTIHDEGKDDYEFLPTAERKWHSGRYWRKLRGITQTLAAMELPALVGLQEVENDSVLRDLTRRTALWPAKYRYIITNSQDERGIDVALLYNPEVFSLTSWHPVRVPTNENGLRPTRDVLVASGIVGEDTLHVCVVHLPSRRNNNKSTRLSRELAVNALCNILDSLENRKILVMGDFNAEPGDKIFTQLSQQLITTMPTDKKTLRDMRGSYYFRGVWSFLDHILVTAELHDHCMQQAQECRFPWLLRTDKGIPHRTYGGTSYLGGISDHLPVILDIDISKQKN